MTVSNISSEATRQVVTKFYVEPSGVEETKLFRWSISHDQHVLENSENVYSRMFN